MDSQCKQEPTCLGTGFGKLCIRLGVGHNASAGAKAHFTAFADQRAGQKYVSHLCYLAVNAGSLF